jgi:hypothetical protein
MTIETIRILMMNDNALLSIEITPNTQPKFLNTFDVRIIQIMFHRVASHDYRYLGMLVRPGHIFLGLPLYFIILFFPFIFGEQEDAWRIMF